MQYIAVFLLLFFLYRVLRLRVVHDLLQLVLGIVAGMIDQLGLVAGIDSRVKQEMRDRHVSIGVGVKAMLINGLGFSQRTLYMVSNYFDNLPVELSSVRLR